ncbi:MULTISPECIES: glutaredoxin family protein [Polyangium]|uniref:Glutaredoxin family protein n=2 Tax=Polyangium TaxID=55 RepID=A0A4U1JJY2_9BACT|nr:MULTISPECIES: glutaredoxin family protein [Polyangium]MDI1433336.1 glutaredoxin family protein [Polyangium sorediatum]TKD13059.1 glutaredoxin family protein [Polyangium fumosum]
MKTLTLYTRERCHLCDVAKEALEQVRSTEPFELLVVDLDHEAPAEKRAAYDWDVPVLELDGRKIMKHRVDEARLLRLIRESEA